MLWLMLGIACVVIDVFIAQTLVILFFGLGALTTALFAYWISDFNHEIILFLATTVFWSAILWQPLTKRKRQQAYSNIIGQKVLVQSKNLAPGERGFGKWSGTSVNIELNPESESAKAGDLLIITKLSGITFYVTKPKEQ